MSTGTCSFTTLCLSFFINKMVVGLILKTCLTFKAFQGCGELQTCLPRTLEYSFLATAKSELRSRFREGKGVGLSPPTGVLSGSPLQSSGTDLSLQSPSSWSQAHQPLLSNSPPTHIGSVTPNGKAEIPKRSGDISRVRDGTAGTRKNSCPPAECSFRRGRQSTENDQ